MFAGNCFFIAVAAVDHPCGIVHISLGVFLNAKKVSTCLYSANSKAQFVLLSRPCKLVFFKSFLIKQMKTMHF